MLTITTALIIRLAKLSPLEQNHLLSKNMDSNFTGMATKCKELSEQLEQEKKYSLAEQVDDLQFLATLYSKKQRKPEAVQIIIGDGQSP